MWDYDQDARSWQVVPRKYAEPDEIGRRELVNLQTTSWSRSLRIIPVLDLQAGQVVRGIAGERQNYLPIVSRLTTSSRPLGIAQAFRAEFPPYCRAVCAPQPKWSNRLER